MLVQHTPVYPYLWTPHRPGGGARRDRTADPLLAKQVLSQLSYGPSVNPPPSIPGTRCPLDIVLGSVLWLVGLGGVEPPTSPLSGVRSNQLSYRPGSSFALRSVPNPHNPARLQSNKRKRAFAVHLARAPAVLVAG